MYVRSPVILCLLVWLFAVNAHTLCAADRLHLGSRFDQQLELPASIFWSEVPLREAVNRLSHARQLAVWLDRRCDPHRPISFNAKLPSLKDCLRKMSADDNNIDPVWLENVIYVGPAQMGNRLATMHEIHRRQLDQMPENQAQKWQHPQGSSWPTLSSPQTLVRQLESEIGYQIIGQSKVLHDLWPATRMPPMPHFQRLELLLAGFELSFTFDRQGNAQIVNMPATPKYAQQLKIPDPEHQQNLLDLLQQHPGAIFSSSTSTLQASWRVHQQVNRLLEPAVLGHRKAAVRYTLQAESQPLGPFLKRLCRQLDLECHIDDSAGRVLDQRISFQVDKVDIETLFHEILDPVGLAFALNNGRLTVSAVKR